jgi:nitroreductase
MIKQLKIGLKKILPNRVVKTLKYKKDKSNLHKGYLYDMQLYIKHSDTFDSDTPSKLIGKIIREYHVIEKGITMPNRRLGFGTDRIILLSRYCLEYIKKYDKNDPQLQHAIGVVFEYKQLHEINNHTLIEEVNQIIKQLSEQEINIPTLHQTNRTKSDFFKNVHAPFHQFANSRSSVRNFTAKEISSVKIKKVLNLAKNTPSACNRQSWRTYIFSNKEQINNILELQGGSRGFGHLTTKLILIAGEVGVFGGVAERYQVYIDGGMYAMNTLYALHEQQIAACILNCSHTPDKDKRMRNICKIRNSEVFIAMIACGIPPANFMVASSKRHEIDSTNTFMN